MSPVARNVSIHGVVQGVAFRHHTKLRARELGLSGWVRNLADGSVEAWLEGEEAPIEDMLRWLHRGPPAARVDRVLVRAVESAGHERFVVRHEDS